MVLAQGFEPRFLGSEPSFLPLEEARIIRSACAGRRSQSGGLRTRCSAPELHTRLGRGGGNRTLAIRLKAGCSTFELRLRDHAVALRFNSRSVLSLVIVVGGGSIRNRTELPRREGCYRAPRAPARRPIHWVKTGLNAEKPPGFLRAVSHVPRWRNTPYVINCSVPLFTIANQYPAAAVGFLVGWSRE